MKRWTQRTWIKIIAVALSLSLIAAAVALQSQRYDHELLCFFKADSLRIAAPANMDWTLDGEFGGALHNVQITNCSRAITFATGKEPEGKES